MEDPFLNSLLRYCNQVTPSRVTYPIPYNNWYSDLRKSKPLINLSTYYLIDKPSLSKNKQFKLSSCHSTIGLTSKKNLSYLSSSQKKRKVYSAGSRKITDNEEIQRIVEREKIEREKMTSTKRNSGDSTKVYNKSYMNSFDKKSRGQTKKVDEEVKMLKDEIEGLKERLEQNSQIVEDLQEG